MTALESTITLTQRISTLLLRLSADGDPQDRTSLSASLRQAERLLKSSARNKGGEDEWIRLLRHYELGATALGWKHT